MIDKREAGRSSYRRLKRQIMEAYGGQCDCCGENRIEFLTMDHIIPVRPNGGSRKGTTGSRLYHMLKKDNFPAGFRPLCFNCNCSFGLFDYCPHQESREWTRPASRVRHDGQTSMLRIIGASGT